EEEDYTDSLAGANLRTIKAPQRFLISSDSSHHSGANIAGAEVDSFARTFVPLMTMTTTVTSTADPATTAKENLVESSIVSGFSVLTGSDFIVGGIRTVHDQLFTEFNVWVARQMSLSAKVRMRVEFNIRKKRRLSSFVKE
ncbi:hypothetical protein Tco_0361456, partial [Tanacetum coccineum]